MSELDVTIDTYLAAWTEADRGRRAAMIGRVWAEDGRLVDPPRVAKGWRSISTMAAVLQIEFPGHRFRRLGHVEHEDGHVHSAWELVAPDGTVGITGVDVGELAADGRLRMVTRYYDVGDRHPTRAGLGRAA